MGSLVGIASLYWMKSGGQVRHPNADSALARMQQPEAGERKHKQAVLTAGLVFGWQT